MNGFEFEWREDEDNASAFTAEFGEWLCRVFPDRSQPDSTLWRYALRWTYYERPRFDTTAKYKYFDGEGFVDAEAAKSAAQAFANMTSYHPPESIWMQVRDDDGNLTQGTEDQTWADESLGDTDVEYVRADVVVYLERLAAALRKYGRHLPDCGYLRYRHIVPTGSEEEARLCSCDFVPERDGLSGSAANTEGERKAHENSH